MTDKNLTEPKEKFFGTYFDRDAVIRMARVIGILSWVVAVIYAFDVALSALVMTLQIVRHIMMPMGPTEFMQNVLFILERPLHGLLYFAAMQAVSKGLLILLDMEDNTRRAAKR